MQTLGIIGSGNIGAAVARLAVASGMNVVIANSRGPESLQDLVLELGPLATAGTVGQAASNADAIVLSVPLSAVKDIPAEWLGDKVVLDTSNYYPSRDGRIEELDTGTLTTTELVHRWLGGARLVKAFSNILARLTGPPCPSRPTTPQQSATSPQSSKGSASTPSMPVRSQTRGDSNLNRRPTPVSISRIRTPRTASCSPHQQAPQQQNKSTRR
jgi:hypothetical protein